MSTFCVYMHISPSGKKYVGITSKNPIVRWQSGTGYIRCPLFYRAIMKYGWDNIEHKVLFKGLSKDRAEKLEINLIRHYKNLGISYNITDGGRGCHGRACSDKVRERIGALYRGKTIPEKTRQAVIRALKGRKLSKEHCEKIRLGKLGNQNGCKTVLQFSREGEFIREFPSCVIAAKALGVNSNNISANARGSKKSAYGFIWKYKHSNGSGDLGE